MKISVDYGRCEGHGLCAEQAPAVFSLDDDVELTYRFEDPRCPTGMSPPPVRQSTHVRLRPCDFRHGDAALGHHRRRVARRTTARELRIIGHCGKVTVIGAEENGAYSRPPLSKAVLRDPAADDTLSHHLDGLDVDIVRSAAVGVDTDRCVVTTADGRQFDYGALVAAPGADARRLAAPGQRGELVLRTLDDARLLRARLETSASAIVLGAGFLGMEVAGACAARGIPVTVVDVARSLERILGGYLSTAITARTEAYGIRFVQATGYATLAGDPVNGVRLPDGTELTADLDDPAFGASQGAARARVRAGGAVGHRWAAVGETWERSAARRSVQPSSTTQRARRRRPVSVRGALR